MIKPKLSLYVLLGLASSSLFAAAPPVHTWHTVSASNSTWEAKLQMLNQSGSFVDRNGAQIDSFTVSPGHSQDYGFSFDAGDDFDVAYTLTLIEKSDKSQFTSKACVYLITASAPAQPDIRPSSYNGAECNYKIVSGVGEDFNVG